MLIIQKMSGCSLSECDLQTLDPNLNFNVALGAPFFLRRVCSAKGRVGPLHKVLVLFQYYPGDRPGRFVGRCFCFQISPFYM